MEINYVLADEMVNSCVFAVPIILCFQSLLFAIVVCACNVADWSIKPYIIVLVLLSRNLEAKIRPVS